MNGSYYQNPTFPNNDIIIKDDIITNSDYNYSEQSYIENILRFNKGKKIWILNIRNIFKKIKAYVSYPDSSSWQNKVYEGIIEQAGKDHLIIKEDASNTWYLIRIIYLDYVEFNEEIKYKL